MRRSRRPRIQDIAAEAGVSPTTVSHALNPAVRGRVAESTRRRVEEIARGLGYEPDPFARALRTNRSYTLAMLSDEIATTPYAGRLILGAQEAAARLGFVLLLMTTGFDPAVEAREIDTLWRYHVDGVLYASTAHRIVDVPPALTGMPLVLVNAEPSRGRHWCIFPDELQGGYIATRALVEAGHTRIGMLNTSEPIPAADGRLAGYRKALSEAGLPHRPHLVTSAEGSHAADGYLAARTVLRRRHPPTALFCFNDRMAMGAFRAAQELGLSVPHDLSVVGFDNQEIIAEALSPSLTTVALPYYEMGSAAVETLADALAVAGEETVRVKPARVAVANRLLYRESVRQVG